MDNGRLTAVSEGGGGVVVSGGETQAPALGVCVCECECERESVCECVPITRLWRPLGGYRHATGRWAKLGTTIAYDQRRTRGIDRIHYRPEQA